MVFGTLSDLQPHKMDYLAITKGLYCEDLQQVYTYQSIIILYYANKNPRAAPY